jgi:hypothetical protein
MLPTSSSITVVEPFLSVFELQAVSNKQVHILENIYSRIIIIIIIFNRNVFPALLQPGTCHHMHFILCLFDSDFLFESFFIHENGIEKFLRNIHTFSTQYPDTSQKI